MDQFGMLERKVAIIGAGFVGASIAYALTIRRLAREIILIDINEKKTEGEALDIQHGIPDMGISSVRAGNYADCSGCDLIIITAGRGRKPGETRLDLIEGNSAILKDVTDRLKKYYTKGVIINFIIKSKGIHVFYNINIYTAIISLSCLLGTSLKFFNFVIA